mmetsp:Transcript_33950/g.79498  ORF Transcript_33950/g.79498 Transcript_33950/m.79498 type:complete len:180 (-) Transcript_33950:466-1005(-)
MEVVRMNQVAEDRGGVSRSGPPPHALGAPRLSDAGRWSALFELGKEEGVEVGGSMLSFSDTSSMVGSSLSPRSTFTCSACVTEIQADSAVFYAMGRRFCSEGCRCLAMSEGVDDELSCNCGRSLELQGACPCFPGDSSCPHLAEARKKLERNGAWGFNKFVCQRKGVRLLDAEGFDTSC